MAFHMKGAESGKSKSRAMNIMDSNMQQETDVTRDSGKYTGFLEVLSPEISALQDYDHDHDLELEDYDDDSCSKESYESENWESDNAENELLGIQSEADDVHPTVTILRSQASKPSVDLVPLDEVDEEEEIDSEEEKDIMKEIKEEIKNQVREEMKSELGLCKAKMDSLGHKENGMKNEEKYENEDLQDMEPKLREAYIKMRKLDRVLAKKIRREKEVKKDRILLERRIREEIANLKPEGREYTDVLTNTKKFIQLALPPSHNEGIFVQELESDPVFATQLSEKEYQQLGSNTNKESRSGRDSRDLNTSSQQTDSERSSTLNGEGSSSHGRRKQKKDFIKRNVELAGLSDNPIAMTDEEKQRIDDLLCNLDTLPESLEEDGQNAWDINSALVIRPGEGFQPEEGELKSLAHIDSRLKELMPPEDYESINSSSSYHSEQRRLFTRLDVASFVDIDNFQEKALLDNREQREMKEKLQRIEDELAKLHNPEEIEIETPRLEEDQLKDLLNQCIRSLSRTSTADTESLTPSMDLNTPRTHISLDIEDNILENPPKLSQAVLQKLLSEAYCPLSSRLATLREETELDEDFLTDQITAETWKIIAQEKSDDELDDLPAVESAVPNGWLSQASSQSSSFSCKRENDNSSINTLRSDSLVSKNESYQSLTEGSLSRNDTRTPFLPEINLSGSLTAQNRTNYRSEHIMAKSAVEMIRNSFSTPEVEANGDVNCSTFSDNGTQPLPVPQPPSRERSSSGLKNKCRNVTPVSLS